MNVCTMQPTTSRDGTRALTGVAEFQIDKGTILVLRKVSDTEYHLRAIDAREGDRSRQSLLSFVEPELLARPGATA